MNAIGRKLAFSGQGRRLLGTLLLAYALALQSMLVAWAGGQVDPAVQHPVFCLGLDVGAGGAPAPLGGGHDHCFTGPCHMGWSPLALPAAAGGGLVAPLLAAAEATGLPAVDVTIAFPPAAPGAPRAPPVSVRFA